MDKICMAIRVDFRSAVPLYVQIVEQMQGLVTSGKLKPGDQLPTVRQLATDLRINFNTVARAYRLLDEAGLISTQRGRGTYIWEPPTPEIIQQLRQSSLSGLIQRFLTEATQQGFSLSEISAAVHAEISTLENA